LPVSDSVGLVEPRFRTRVIDPLLPGPDPSLVHADKRVRAIAPASRVVVGTVNVVSE
jgi:hypothetical protein